MQTRQLRECRLPPPPSLSSPSPAHTRARAHRRATNADSLWAASRCHECGLGQYMPEKSVGCSAWQPTYTQYPLDTQRQAAVNGCRGYCVDCPPGFTDLDLGERGFALCLQTDERGASSVPSPLAYHER
jgi:hypothetical protein